MKKKMIGAATAILAVTALLAACSPSGGTSTPPPSTAAPTTSSAPSSTAPALAGTSMVFWDRSEYVPTYKDMETAQVAKFDQETGVKTEYISVAPGDIMAKLSAAIEAKQVPDLLAVDSSTATQFISTGVFMDVTDFLKQFDFRADALNLVTKIEGNFEVPLYLVPNALYVRNDKLAAAGITKTPETWQEVLEAARAMNDAKNGFYGAGFQLAPVSAGDCEGFTRSLMDSYGATLVDANGKVVVKDNADKVKQALTMIKTFYDEGLVPASAITGDNAWNNEQYLAGNIGMTLNSGSILTAAKKQDPTLAEHTTVTGYPGGPAGRYGSGGVMSFMIKKDGNVAAAMKYLKDYFFDPTYYEQIQAGLLGLAVTVMNGQEGKGIWAQPGFSGWYTASKNMLTVGYPAPPDARASQLLSKAVLSGVVQDMILNNVPLDKVVDNIDAKYKEVYGS